MNSSNHSLLRVRGWLLFFILGLVFSGVTAIPLEIELRFLARTIGADQVPQSALAAWIAKVREGLVATNDRYPFLAYGTDWLAFAHFVLAILFVGPLRDPVKNIWVIEFGMIACLLVVPYAFTMGAVRGIPIPWRLIDCSFGVFGILPLWLCWRQIKRMREEGDGRQP